MPDFELQNLATALLAGRWCLAAMTRRAMQAQGLTGSRVMRRLVRRVYAQFPSAAPLPDVARLTAILETLRATEHFYLDGELRRVYWQFDVMAPAAGTPATWQVPALTSPGQLADWLGLTVAELDWFADCQRRLRLAEAGPLWHYSYRWLLGRRSTRLLEMPKARLRFIQRRILRELLDKMPPHSAAHAYCRGRSLVSYVTPHAARRLVVRLDLRRFFTSIHAGRVHALFRTAGYPQPVARLLTGLCTSCVPEDVLESRPSQVRDNDWRDLREPHLPQGAPTSPALANLCAYRLDCRLAGLSRVAGAAYTRYADDLIFSGDRSFERSARRFHVHVCRIVLEEGFEVNTRKTHFMRPAVRQQVAGIVLNARPNLPREDFDRLKAILTNCIRHGPAGQNRTEHVDFRGHLAGRIAYWSLINPARGQRLRALFDRIDWSDGER